MGNGPSDESDKKIEGLEIPAPFVRSQNGQRDSFYAYRKPKVS